mgnify:CR=1 FL=1
MTNFLMDKTKIIVKKSQLMEKFSTVSMTQS